VLVTGALHEDGLADAADAIGAHATPQRRLDILRGRARGRLRRARPGLRRRLAFALLAPLDDGDFLRARWSGTSRALVDPPPVADARTARPDGAGCARPRRHDGHRHRDRICVAVALIAGRPAAARSRSASRRC